MSDNPSDRIRIMRFSGVLYNERGHPIHRQRPMAELQRMAGRVWQGELQRGPQPTVRGDWATDAQSYCLMSRPRLIVLARGQMDLLTLLHEMAHAIGGERGHDHGPAFMKRYARFLYQYGGMDLSHIQLALYGAGWK
jgi:hypothetical protein